MSKPYLEVEDVHFSYGGNTVLDGVSFSIFEGDYVGIIGPNGGGKTTLLKIILGLVTPDHGTVRVAGHDIHRYKGRQAFFGYVPQRIAQSDRRFPATVEEVVASGRAGITGIMRRFSREDRDAVTHALERTGIASYRHRLIHKLSGGELQKVFIARALAGDSRMLILDEPFTGVDIASQKQFYAFLGDLNRNQRLTILFVSHDVDVVSSEAKSVICLNKELFCEGPASRLGDPDVMKRLYGDRIHLVAHAEHNDTSRNHQSHA